ncbi:ras-like protein family member 11A-like isoform X2 [Oryzias melastigma]|uniref:ras-like protein family member 11A-like isoform X2 n=1 Tax=Oryzias melastigma TaxID=30732 RepID=UPI00168D1909|nr:ras-like protein family member 11A-like isoform X2 [Oryzias melastigma]
MRLTAGPGTMSGGSANFLLVPIPEFPLPDSALARTVKIAVLGASNVGKTALIVRFLTKRFIGDYEANTGECVSVLLKQNKKKSQPSSSSFILVINPLSGSAGALYSRKVTLDGEEVSLQVQDTPCVALQDDPEGLYCQEQINRPQQLQNHPAFIPACQAYSPVWKHSRYFGWQQERLAASKAGVSRRRRDVSGISGRGLLRGVCQRKPRGSPCRLPASLPGGDPSTRRREWREKEGRPPPGQTQISQHAGAEEEVQAGPVIQSQVSDNHLIPSVK